MKLCALPMVVAAALLLAPASPAAAQAVNGVSGSSILGGAISLSSLFGSAEPEPPPGPQVCSPAPSGRDGPRYRCVPATTTASAKR